MINLLDLDAAGLVALFGGMGERPFRAKQVLHWVHQRFATDVQAMTDLSKPLREKLAAVAEIRGPAVVSDTTAADGTRKWLLDVGAGNAVEAVFIPEDDRGTLCISSQAGCALDCAFCSTGKQGFNRNLTTAEIVGQLWHANRALLADGGVTSPRSELRSPPPEGAGTSPRSGLRSPPPEGAGDLGAALRSSTSPRSELRSPPPEGAGDLGAALRSPAPWVEQGRAPITNVVMMGMGEPLANFDAVVRAMSVFLDDNAYGLSRRRVTLSTSGLVPALDRLGAACPVALAVSLHAPDDALRDRLVPINRKYPLPELLAACRRYLAHAPRDFVTFEYVMLDGVNDAPAQARALARLVQDVPCKLNLIPFNPFPGTEFRTSPRARILAFQRTLADAGLVATIRKTRGEDIDAACGQLAGRVQDRTQRRVVRLRQTTPTH